MVKSLAEAEKLEQAHRGSGSALGAAGQDIMDTSGGAATDMHYESEGSVDMDVLMGRSLVNKKKKAKRGKRS